MNSVATQQLLLLQHFSRLQSHLHLFSPSSSLQWSSTLWREDTQRTLKWQRQFPLLLPSKDHFTDLVIHSTHVKQLHAGVNSTSTALRQTYWVPSSRQRVKTLIDKCATCRKVSGTAYNAPDPPPLPKSRMQQTQPFEVTGVDFTEALYVRNAGIETKVYNVCLLVQQPGLFILKLSKT